MWGRGMALLAWKLGSRGMVVSEVVVLGSGVVGGSSGVYRRIKRGGTVNTSKHNKQLKGMTMNCNQNSNVERYTLHGAGVHPGMKYRLRLITGLGVRRGGNHVGGVVDIRQT